MDLKDLKDLKVGDYVLVCYNSSKRIKKIEKITPKGFIKVDGTLYNQNGDERGGNVWFLSHIKPATKEEVKAYLKQEKEQKYIRQVISYINSIPMTFEQATRIADILGMKISTNSL